MRVLTVALAVLAIAGMAQGAEILMDFGEPPEIQAFPEGPWDPNPTYKPTPSPDPFQSRHWNNLCMAGDGDANTITAFPNMVDANGVGTAVSAAVTGFTTDGNKGMDAEVVYPNTAQHDAVGVKGIDSGGSYGTVTISGLSEPAYNIRLFSSTHEDVSWYNDDTRRTFFRANGHSLVFYGSGNTDQTMTLWNVAPVGGVILLEVTGAIPGGEATYSYGYLNVAELFVVPEPATLSLLALGALAAIRRRR